MKSKTLLAAAALAIASMAMAAEEHSHGAKPMHGGIVIEANDIEFELVAKAGTITIHVRDHGKTLATKGATGKLTVLTGAAKTDGVLTPAGDNMLQAMGSFNVGPGSKLVATVNLPGKKPINVRFALK